MKYKVYVDWLTQWGKDYLAHLKQIFQGKLTAGDNVTIDENNTISVDGVLTTVDETLDPASENPVENQAIYAACYGLGQGITNLQSNKVDKEQGKGLSSNDYTTTEKNKLNGIADNAEVNVQSDWNESDNTSDAYIQNKPTIPTVNDGLLTIQQNGTTVETFSANQSGNKIANIQVPTKTSDITNDSGFILNTVNNLTNYYLKSETYTRTEVANLISQAITGVFIFVQTLPTASASTMGKIYLVPKSTPETNNIKDEYITVEENSTYSWEHIGDTAVDLTGFVKYIEFNGGTYAVTTNTTTITLPDAFYTESEIDILIQDFLESSTLERVEYVQTTPSEYESDTLYVIDDGSDTHVFATIATTGMLSDAIEDSTHRTVTDAEKSSWNGKADFSGSYNDLTDKPTIPDELADLTSDSTHRTVTDSQISTWNNKSDFSGSYNDLINKPSIYTQSEINTLIADFIESGTIDRVEYVQAVPSTYESDTLYVIDDGSGSYVLATIATTGLLADAIGDSTHRTVTDTEKSTWNGKQNALTFDSTPTDGSTNPVTSDGIYDALSGKADSTDLADYMTKVNPTGSGSLSINRTENTTVGRNSVALGSNNEASGIASIAIGAGNTVTGTQARVIGANNTVESSSNFVIGGSNTATGSRSNRFIIGTSNSITGNAGSGAIVIGKNNSMSGSSSDNILIGNSLVGGSKWNQINMGYLNANNSDAIFTIGNGYEQEGGVVTRRNALEVLDTGELVLGANPTASMHAVSKSYLESKFIMISENDYDALTSYESNATYYVY